MADPRLAWRQLNVAAPNVSGLMSGANNALNNATSAADNILGRYDEGQKLKGDQELARLLSTATNQEELNTLANSEAVRGLRLSENGIAMLNQAQGNRVNWENTRSQIRDRDGRLVIAGDVNARAGEVFGWERADRNDSLARRDWQRDNAGLYIQGEQNAYTNGTSFSAHIDRTESGGGRDQYDTLFGHRNRNNGVRVSEMTIGQAGEFASPNGQYGQSVNSEIGRVATPMGKFQIVGSTLRKLQQDLGLPDSVPFSAPVQEQLGLYLAQQRVNGPRSQQAMRDGLRAEWAGFKNVSDAELDVMIDEIRSMPPVNRDSILAAAQGGPAPRPQQGFQPQTRDRGGAEYAAAMAQSGLFTGSETLGAIDPLRDAAIAGQAEIDTQRLKFQNDVLAAAVQEAASSSQALNAGEAENLIRDQLLATGEFSEQEAVEAVRRGTGLINDSEGLSQNLAGKALDAGIVGNIESAAANAVADANRQLNGTDQARAVADIQRYWEGEPHKTLEADLGIPEDAQTLGSYRPEMLRRLVNKYADKFEVEPAVIAVAMRDAYVPDPGDDERSSFWYNSDLTLNTLERRFSEDAVAAAVAQLDPNARRDFDRASSSVSTMEARLNQNSQQQQTVLRRMNKLNPNDPSDAREYEQLQRRLDSLTQQAATLSRE